MPIKSPPPQEQDRQPGIEAEMDPPPEYMPRYAGSNRLAGKTLLITGGDSGIGRAVCVLFAREGANVAFVYLDEHGDAERTADLVEAEGAQVLALSGDVRVRGFCEQAAAETVARFGGLDILINHAAEQHARDDFEDISEEQFRRTFDTNVFGYFHMLQAALPYIPKGGAIINTTSVTAYRGSGHLVDYAGTRGAVLALTRSLATQLAGRGIRVNGVAPGPIWTPLIPASFPAEHVGSFGSNTALGRPGQPNEVAPSYLFLACEDSSYMTGQVFHPNGGEIVGG